MTITPEEADQLLAAFLKARGQDVCPKCQRIMGREDFTWRNTQTEAGTGCIDVEVTCSRCGTEIAHGASWYPWADTFEEAIENTLDEDEWQPGAFPTE